MVFVKLLKCKIPSISFIICLSLLNGFGQGKQIYLKLKVEADTTIEFTHSSTIYLENYQNTLLFEIFNNDKNLNNEYYYKLEGLNDKWIYLKNQNRFIVSNLLGGKYTLKVKQGEDDKNIESLDFEIAPLIWQNSWFLPLFYVFTIMIISMIGYLFSSYRTRTQLKTLALKHELEIKALRAQMNPHFIFNSMNTIDAYILRKRFIEASDCLQKFSKLIRQILENSENQTISIAQELETLKLYIELEQERFSHSFSYQFDIQPELLDKDYQIPPLLIQPFVENAILHGIRHLTERKGEILLNLSIKDSVLLCVITDNGIGRRASSEINKQRQESHKSMGVDITMERISSYQALYGDKMETNIADLGTGTRVEIKLPLILA